MALVDVSVARKAGLETFGDSVVYSPAAGGSFTVPLAVYTGPVDTFEIGSGEASVSSTSPTLLVDLGDFPAPPLIGDTLVRDGVTWRVSDVQRDGQGGATLRLQRFD